MTHILTILLAAWRRILGGTNGRAGARRPPRSANARAALLLCLVLGAFAAIATPALSATEAATTPAQARAQHLATLLAERQARLAVKREESEQRRQRARELRAARLALKTSANSGGTRRPVNAEGVVEGYVEISCAGVIWHYENFGPGVHTVTQVVRIDGTAQPTTTFTFTGETGEDVTPIAESASKHHIDALARWNDNGVRGDWDIDSIRTCGTGGTSGPAFTIEKRQRILGSGAKFVTEQLTGEVGQTVEYAILVTNTGDVYLTFTAFTDPRCDPGTLKGGFEGPVAPSATVEFKCTHVITVQDQEAKEYVNTAMVTGTPSTGGTPVTTPTNTVVVQVPPVSGTPTPPQGPGSTTTGTTTTPTGSIGVLGTSGSHPPGTGGQGSIATSSTVPAISGVPRGCARSNFVIRVRARGVRSAVFYIDNHRVRTLTARNARAGMFTLHVNVSKLKLGVHRLKVRITMTALTASRRPLVATRTLKFAHCSGAGIIGPRFTG